MDTDFDRTPFYNKYRRVFELVVGPQDKIKTRILMTDITNNPQSYARKITADYDINIPKPNQRPGP